MIISASRRTDIPNYYSDWFYNRIKEEFLYVRNPMNFHQVSKITLSKEVVDCIVFWTKNPEPMIERLDELKSYNYYFQFTLTGYGTDIETSIPHKKNKMLSVFQRLSEQIGKERVIWRYDPILFNKKYTKEYHINAFNQIAENLNGSTERCIISFIDIYKKNKKEMELLKLQALNEIDFIDFLMQLKNITKNNKMEILTCAEKLDLEAYGISHSSCIDKQLIETIFGFKLGLKKDKNQRLECGCVESIDIGCYDTCRNGCKYCYANGSKKMIMNHYFKYNNKSPLLCDEVKAEDKIIERKMKSFKENQINLFDK